MEQFMKLRQEKNPPRPPNEGMTRPPAEATTTEGNTATETSHPTLTTNGWPRQYGTNGTARGNLTETQANPDKTDEMSNNDTISKASSVHSNGLELSTEDLNQLVQIRKIMTMFFSMAPDQDDPDNRKMNMGMTDHYRDMDIHCKWEVYTHAFAMFQPSHYFSTTDGGADTCILGKGWKFRKVYLHRSVNIVGYHEAHT
jgi:hypothetical protein